MADDFNRIGGDLCERRDGASGVWGRGLGLTSCFLGLLLEGLGGEGGEGWGGVRSLGARMWGVNVHSEEMTRCFSLSIDR